MKKIAGEKQIRKGKRADVGSSKKKGKTTSVPFPWGEKNRRKPEGSVGAKSGKGQWGQMVNGHTILRKQNAPTKAGGWGR